MDKLDILGLKAFVSVAEQGSFRKAAQHLNLTSTAVSRRVQKLEDSLGVLLISRTTRQVTLTRLGVEFLQRSQELLGSLEGLLGDARNRGRYGENRVAVACLPTVAVHFMPAILQTFARAHPDVAITLMDKSATQILDAVRNEEADFGLTFLGSEHPDLRSQLLYSEPMVAWGRPELLGERISITWRELTAFRLIAIGRLSGTRRLIDEALAAHDVSVEFLYELEHLHTAMSLAQGGLGIAVLPQISAQPDMHGLIGVPVSEPAISRSIGLFRRNDIPLTPLANAFLRVVLHHFKTERISA